MIHTSNVRINTVKAVIASALAVSPTVKLLISFNVSNISITTQVQTIIFAKEIRNTSLYVRTLLNRMTKGLMTI